jgi:hypothetical protein
VECGVNPKREGDSELWGGSRRGQSVLSSRLHPPLMGRSVVHIGHRLVDEVVQRLF